MLLFGANRVLVFTMVHCSATECVNYTWIRTRVLLGTSFLAFCTCRPSARSDSRSGCPEWGLREDVIARRGSRLYSEHVRKDCFEARSLLRRELARSDGSYLRKCGRTLKATAIPTRLPHTVCRVAMLAQCQLGRGEEKSTSVTRYPFVRSWLS